MRYRSSDTGAPRTWVNYSVRMSRSAIAVEPRRRIPFSPWIVVNIHAISYIIPVTPKRVMYTGHAVVRLRGRHITRQDVRRLIATGVRSKAPTAIGAQRWQCKGKLGRADAAVIFIEDAATILVLTVYWAD